MEVLKRLYSEDELTVEELEERLDRCYRAGSLDELEELFSDLPARPDLTGSRRPGRGEGAAGSTDRRSRTDSAGWAEGRAKTPSDGSGTAGGRSSPARRTEPTPPAERARHDLVLAVMGGVKRSGRWTPPRHMNVLAVMGGAELDFRQARFPRGVTSVHAVAVMGGVHVIVPPGLRVESTGLPLMGGFDRVDQDGDGESFPGAVLRIRGAACMGAVEVEVREPGE